MKKLAPFLIVLLLSGCLSSSKQKDSSPVLARFDGQAITEKQFVEKVKFLPKPVQSLAGERKKDLLEDMAAEHFLLKEAKKQGLAEEDDVQDLVEAAKRKILIAKLVEKEVDERIQIAPDEVSKYYELHKEDFMTPLMLRASHILLKTEEDAIAVKALLDGGADFEETARQRSTDATAIRGGDLGFFQRGQFVPEFEEAVFSMTKNEIRGPVKSPFGYHIIKLNDRVEPRLRELKSVRTLVEERLVNEKRSKAFKDFVARIKGSSKVDVDEAALEKIRL